MDSFINIVKLRGLEEITPNEPKGEGYQRIDFIDAMALYTEEDADRAIKDATYYTYVPPHVHLYKKFGV